MAKSVWINISGVIDEYEDTEADIPWRVKPICKGCGKKFRKGQKVYFDLLLGNGEGLTSLVVKSPGSLNGWPGLRCRGCREDFLKWRKSHNH